MSIEIKVPVLPESVADATIANWHKQVGDQVSRDENLVDIETDKVVLEVPAPDDGVLEEIREDAGATVSAHQVIGVLGAGDGKSTGKSQSEGKKSEPAGGGGKETAKTDAGEATEEPSGDKPLSPAVRKLINEHDLDPSRIEGSGKNGRILKEDVLRAIDNDDAGEQAPAPDKRESEPAAEPKPAAEPEPQPAGDAAEQPAPEAGARTEKRVPMTRLRARIAERLLQAQSNAAMLTTFNEVNMQPVMDLRGRYKDAFEKQHGVKLGFMSFFIKAATEALKRFPEVNASIDGNDIVYHGYYDIGVAVSSPRGLVVPILRNTELMSMADMEKTIIEFGQKAKDGTLSIDEMTGGTFTISNGGIFGSLLSTPILNPPQSGILGMHKIEQRAVVAEDGNIVARPMMYLALSYDHRIIDGKGAVQFLVTIKELLEDPARMLLEL